MFRHLSLRARLIGASTAIAVLSLCILSAVAFIVVRANLLDTLDEPDASLETQWAREAESRLAAYRRGEIQAASLSDVIAKYKTDARPA